MKFLICDDDLDQIDLLLAFLVKEYDFAEIIKCTDGLQAIEHIKTKGDIDIIISDQDTKINGGLGLDIYQFLIETSYNSLFILTSGDADASEFIDYISQKNFHFLTKPVCKDKLTYLIARYILPTYNIKKNQTIKMSNKFNV